MNELDLFGAIALAGAAAYVALTLALSLAPSLRSRIGLILALAAWLALVVWLATTRLFTPPTGANAVAAAVALPVTLTLCLFSASAKVRSYFQASPIALLIALHFARIFGAEFVLLQEAGRLAWPFAPIAGWGDVAIGLFALPVAALVRAKGPLHRVAAWTFTVFGTIDLLAAVVLGITSAPDSPVRIFFDQQEPVLTSLPWALVPGFLVPCFFIAHFAALTSLLRQGGPSNETSAIAPT